MSSALPPGTGNTILIGLVGKLSCAEAGVELIDAATRMAASKKRHTLSSLRLSPAQRRYPWAVGTRCTRDKKSDRWKLRLLLRACREQPRHRAAARDNN